MSRTYADAVAALNTLQSNYAVVQAIRKAGWSMNQQAIPEMIEWTRKVGYQPEDFNRLNLIHIAGTKGKGSTAAFTSSILSQYIGESSNAGSSAPIRSIGLYTSPHLRFVRERIQINNKPLSEEQFARYFFEIWDRLEKSAKDAGEDPNIKPVYFRFVTLMAFHAYITEGVDAAVIECGIGGEYDTTNIITQPVVTGITNLALDHLGMLGNTLEEIAWHKAGIMKRGTKCFSVTQRPEAHKVLQDRAQEKAVDLQIIAIHPELDDSAAKPVPLGLSASFQKTNASLAIAISQHFLTERGFPNLTDPTPAQPKPLTPEFRNGLLHVRWSGRCETRNDATNVNLTWYIDGGHTLESIELVAKWFAEQVTTTNDNNNSQLPSPRILIFNQQTRDAPALVRALYNTLATALPGEPPFTHAIFCPNTTFSAASTTTTTGTTSASPPDLVSRNTDAEEVKELRVQRELARVWTEMGGEGEGKRRCSAEVVGSVEEAVRVVRGLGSEKRVKVLVTGSLHLVGALLEVLESGVELASSSSS